MIPIAKPMIGEEEIEAATRVLRSGQLSQGPEVEKFEEEFAEYIGVDHAVAVSNGTTALLTAVHCALPRHSVVHTTPFSFISTATSILMADRDIKFHDVYSNGLLPVITAWNGYGGPDYSGDSVLLVHLYGNPCNMSSQCDQELPVIEDCAQAVGAEHNGRKVGSFGVAGCFSFYSTKNVTSGGEGGMITTNVRSIADKCRLERNHGDSGKYSHQVFGANFRMTDLQAAIGRVQLRSIDRWNDQRICNAKYYDENLSPTGLGHISPSSGGKHVYHQYVLLVGDDFPMTRDNLARHLLDNGIGCAVHYPMPIPHQQCFGRYEFGEFPVALNLSRRVLSIPVGPWVTNSDCRYIADVINSVPED